MSSTTYTHPTNPGEAAWAKDPFVDPRVSLDSTWSSNPAHTTRTTTTTASSSFISRPSTDTTNQQTPIISSNTPTRPRGNTLQVSNDISDALSQELDHNPSDREMLKAERMRDKAVSTTTSSSSSRRRTSDSKDGLWHQLRTGTGWFSPVVPPEPVLSREEREAKERARIDRLKSGEGSTKRPSFMKRMSSGVEMLGFGGGNASSGGGSSTSPRKR
ncbi:hypothetical protein OIV83_004651 [Microbotryomycetes sp. JL201]|nr:hypothetical protein OIV83_004651 [Microbotryomycetes sp. JL201]